MEVIKMKKYKPIYVSPEVQAELKAFSALEFRSMGEMAEEIIMKHINESNEKREVKVNGWFFGRNILAS